MENSPRKKKSDSPSNNSPKIQNKGETAGTDSPAIERRKGNKIKEIKNEAGLRHRHQPGQTFDGSDRRHDKATERTG